MPEPKVHTHAEEPVRSASPVLLLVAVLFLTALSAPVAASARVKAAPLHAEPVTVTAPSETLESTTPIESSGTSEEAPLSETPVNASPKQTGDAHRQLQREGRCQVSVVASAALVILGEAVALSGSVTCPAGTEAAGQTVTVFQRARGAGSTFTEAGTATSEADGIYHFTSPDLQATTIFSARLARGRSAPATVKVAPRITVSGPPTGTSLLTPTHGRRSVAQLTGSVTPAVPGERITLQSDAPGSEQWHTIAFGQVDSEGHYSIGHGFRTPGEVSLRVVVHAGGSTVAAASEPVSFLVAQAQNPELTILSAEDPVISGQSTTITGALSGGAGQSVTLLERTPGHPFAVVEKEVTGAGGSYSFTISPSQSTYYRVTSATQRSTDLPRGRALSAHDRARAADGPGRRTADVLRDGARGP